ncbi:putative cytochrome c biogenesis protein [Streptomyces sp. NBRC 110611]|uniref:cytochrome c biogenesis CcdA family protein n=1 Tax=Streptomyces sp. NBRC 110611 TaxID=1621259 RepID=UPI000837485F|nr:cytochrome c biogenesis protein CcdA [Streptomyces sp. NBRC 110611]GAU70856.1 putative cytochrome c biogenesis protein [Streptomyces sp. NBRC 110611]
MSGVPYALALTAGMLAAVNPCGFALLPAYLTLFISGDPGSGDVPRRGPVLRALVAAAAMTTGFTTVFGAFALLVSPLARSLERSLPWATLTIGVLLLVLGGWLLSGRALRLPLPRLRTTAHPADSARTMALYGISYALASLSCTIGPFLALTSTAVRTGSPAGAIGVFAVYSAGMGAVVGVLTLAVALSRQALIARIRRALPYVTRASGALLLLAGAYVAHYGWYEIRLRDGAAAEDPVVATATRWQGTLTHWLDAAGPAPVLGSLVLLAVGGWTARAVRSRRRRTPGPLEPDPSEGH